MIVGRGHRLAGRKNVSIEELLAHPFVAPPMTTPAGSYLYDMLNIGSLPQTPVRVVSSSLILVRGLLALGDYITIISLQQVRHEIDVGLFVPLDVKLTGNSRAIGLTFRKSWRPTATQERFLELVRSASREAIQ